MKDFQPTHVRLNDLPVVITGVGEYKTRGGDSVLIHEVLDDPKDGCTRFLAKGDIYRTNKIGHKRTFMYSSGMSVEGLEFLKSLDMTL